MLSDIEKGQKLISQLAREKGIGVGDVLVKLTTYFKIPPCSRCKRWQQILNKFKIKGWKITWEDIGGD